MTLPSGWELVQVMHGCRQLVSWDVGLSPETSATLVTSCQRIMPGTLVRLLVNSRRKAGIRQVIMSLMPRATHMLQWEVQRVAKPQGGANLKKPSPVRIVVCNSTT